MSVLVLTDDQRFSRDTGSRALLNTDMEALNARKKSRDIEMRLKAVERSLSELNTTVANLLEALKIERTNV